jgi:hypothetical protein
MKKVILAAAALALILGSALTALPTAARVGPASDLQVVINGRDGVASDRAGCTRITNRFCVLSTRSNCFAC